MGKITDQFENILLTLMEPSALHKKMPEQDRTWYEWAMSAFEQIQKERDAYVIGEDEEIELPDDKASHKANRIGLRAEQRARAKQTL